MFDPRKFSTLGGQLKGGRAYQTFGYMGDEDGRSVITAAGYFNEIKETLRKNDLIQVLDRTVTPTNIYYVRVSVLSLNGAVEVEDVSSRIMTDGTLLEVRVLTPGAAGTTSCGATFEGWYETV